MDPNLVDEEISTSEGHKLKFKDMQHVSLKHPPTKFPFRRLLAFHMKCSLLAAVNRGWITVEQRDMYNDYLYLSESASEPDVDFTDEEE